jgi:hypothetical protein
MKIKISELRQIIRDVVNECYGWPVEKEESLYGVPNKMGAMNPADPKNKALKFPKGPNSRGSMNESFQRITPRELAAWSMGNYEPINEAEVTQDPCDECGMMVDSHTLTEKDGVHVCEKCC